MAGWRAGGLAAVCTYIYRIKQNSFGYLWISCLFFRVSDGVASVAYASARLTYSGVRWSVLFVPVSPLLPFLLYTVRPTVWWGTHRGCNRLKYVSYITWKRRATSVWWSSDDRAMDKAPTRTQACAVELFTINDGHR